MLLARCPGWFVGHELHGHRRGHAKFGIRALGHHSCSSVRVGSHRVCAIRGEALPHAPEVPHRVAWATQETPGGRPCHLDLRWMLQRQVHVFAWLRLIHPALSICMFSFLF